MNRRFEDSEEFTWQPYRIKPLAVWAMRMNNDFECASLEGTLFGHAGDWLVRADDGWTFPVADQIFRRYYVKREWRKSNEGTQRKEDADQESEADSTSGQKQNAGKGLA